MKEIEWKERREQTKRRLESILSSITMTRELGVLLGAENDYYDIIEFQTENLLGYFDERSVVSRIRFVEGAKDE